MTLRGASERVGELFQPLEAAIAAEPIAIVGIGCRFPGGAHDLESYWNLLINGVDAIREAPEDRFSIERFYSTHVDKPGRTRSRWGGFVEQRIELFDALFFGMSPREAAYLDPMQRWLLEVSWEAFEDAGLVPELLAGSNTAVFVGGFTEDIKLLQMDPANRGILGPHAATGSAMTMLANRLSHFYDLRGPSVALDTACSSSLVATHLACQSLWSGESTLALAGGVNAMFRAEYTIAESKAGMLSPDGRSKAFDSRANGYVRGEGAGIVVLEPLSRAIAVGHHIHAVIRGSAVNQDGHTNGITVPNGAAQQRLIRAACARAGITPAEIGYVEAHGTGTPVGDPIEVNALGETLSEGRPAGESCWIGSVKTNFGHLEAAAGIAGLIKAALVVSHRRIPPHLHLIRPNPAIDLPALGLRVPDRVVEFPSGAKRYVSVNSFGFGGTNAHVILDAAPTCAKPALEPRCEGTEGPTLVTLSARSHEALLALAKAHAARLPAERLESDQQLPPDALTQIAHSTRQHRSHHEYRLGIRARSIDELRERLQAVVEQQPSSGLAMGRRSRKPGAPVFVFSGMGPQWWGMGQTLLATEPVFRRAVEACDALFRPLAGWSLLDEMQRSESETRMSRTDVAQPTSFALQVGLFRYWQSLGVTPAAIVGHSAGEVAAAYAAGVYSLEHAVTVIYHRSRLQQRTTGQGKLVALGVSMAEAEAACADWSGRISIAAVNGPRTLTIVGDEASLAEFLRPFEARNTFIRPLQVAVPYHSHYMDPLEPELRQSLAGIRPQSAAVPFYSTVTGRPSNGSEWSADYWWRNVRKSVLFAAAIDALAEAGHDTFLELGAHPVLGSAIAECCAERNVKPTVVTSLRRHVDEQETLLDALATLYATGQDPDFSKLSPAGASFVELPHYPFQRQEHWAESAASRRYRLGDSIHPLLGERASSPSPSFETEIGTERLGYLADHVVRGNVVFPGAGYVEMMLAALRHLHGASAHWELTEIAFQKALFLRADRDARLMLSVDPDELKLAIHGAPEEEEGSDAVDQPWTLHAKASCRRVLERPGIAASDPIEDDGLEPLELDACYAYLASLGLEYGPTFRGIRKLRIGKLRANAAVGLAESIDVAGYSLHPALLDACFQVMLAATASEVSPHGEARMYLPVRIRSLKVYGEVPRRLTVRTVITQFDEQTLSGDLSAFDEHERLVIKLDQVEARSIEQQQASGPALQDLLYEVQWQRDAPAAPETKSETTKSEAGRWLVLGNEGPNADALVAELEELGQRCVRVRFGDAFAAHPNRDGFTVNPAAPSDFTRLVSSTFEDNCAEAWRGILHLGTLDEAMCVGSIAERIALTEKQGPIALLHCLQALEQSGVPARVYAVTRGVHAAVEEGSDSRPQTERSGVACSLENVSDSTPRSERSGVACSLERELPLGAALWGMLRGVAYQEAPHRFGGLLDLSREPSRDELARVARDLVSPEAPDQRVYRDRERFRARLVPTPQMAKDPVLPRFRADATYLITGGLGGLGMQVARWMVRQNARRLILMGRTALPERDTWHAVASDSPAGQKVAFVRELESQGVSVELAPIDVADEAALAGFLEQHRRRALPPIRGVVHAAGLSEPRLLAQMTQDDYARTARPKVIGALLLDRYLGDSLDHFVLFSSVAAFGFTAGQSDYAAANAVLDALAQARRQRGLPALSINYGPWAEAGMATLLGDYFEHRGMTPFAIELGLQGLGVLLGCNATQHTVLWVSDPKAFREDNFSGASDVRFIDAIGAQVPAAATSSVEEVNAAQHIFEVPELEAQQERALAVLRSLLSRVMRLQLAQVESDRTLTQLGLDSLLAVELKNRIMTELDTSIPVVELLRGNTVLELARDLHRRLAAHAPGAAQSPVTAPAEPSTTTESSDRAPETQPSSTADIVPLGPNQYWFFARQLENPHHWNMAALWEVTRPIPAVHVRAALEAVIAHHELLRARFTRSGGEWEQRIMEVGDAVPFSVVSLVELPAKQQSEAIEAHIVESQASLDLERGPLLAVTYFDLGPGVPARLLTVIHHVVSDVYSQQVLVADIALACQQLQSGDAIHLPAQSDRYADWVRRLHDFACGDLALNERRYWTEQRWQPSPLPQDYAGRGSNSIHSARIVTAAMPTEETSAFLRAIPRHFGTSILDVLMTAFAAAIRDWSRLEHTLLDVIVHGREAPGEDMDLGRTVGLFAHGIPLCLQLPNQGSPSERLAQVRTQLEPFQRLGRNFAALRWLSNDAELVAKLAAIPKRELIFNYIGQFESAQDAASLLRILPTVPRALEAKENERDFVLQCQVGILNGELTLLLNYSENLHRRSTIERLALAMLDHLRSFIAAAEGNPTSLDARQAS